jgi:hypothetical protein
MAGTLAKWVGNYDSRVSLGTQFRRRRAAPLMQMIEDCFRSKGAVQLLDVGGMEKYWNICDPDWLAARRVRVTLSNLPDDILPVDRPDVFEAHEGDGCALPFGDDAFDICHSNSTIEHVGTWSRKTAFANECRRIAPAYFIQTPNFWFPWEPHFGVPFYHWLPDPARLWLAGRVALGWHHKARDVGEGMQQVEYASLLSRPMMEFLFPDGEIVAERLMGLTKSFVAIRRSR